MSLGLTGASQKIASLMATANQAQFQTRTLNPVALVRNLHGTQQVMVTTSSCGETGQVTLIPQSVQLLHPQSSSGQTGVNQSVPQNNQVQIVPQQVFSQQVILQKPLGSDQQQNQSSGNCWSTQDVKSVHVLVSYIF